jgi:uncharacterized protein with ParB-like and HNH nuclease domain
MAENQLEQTSILRNVQSLLKEHFYVPKYQRGYRWTSRQVRDLLNDIDSFTPSNDEGGNSWYCLQPLVVKKGDNKEEWRLVDGQQRVTTIKLILHYLSLLYVESKRKTLFSIEYETRGKDEDWLGILDDENKSKENIDFAHIYSAYQNIKEWFDKKGDNYDTFKFSSKLLSDCKFIWYDIDQNGQNKDKEEDVFIRLNDGKIPLTNSELIKALFLNSYNFSKDKNEEEIRLRQLEISTQWDIIEQELSDDEFWYFINGKENNVRPRIEYIFDEITQKPQNIDDKDFTFRYFQEKFENNKLLQGNKEEFVKNEWENILNTYLNFKEWHKDKYYYHLIGYLLCVNYKVADLLTEYQDNDKDVFRHALLEKIQEVIKWDGKEEIKYRKVQGRESKILLLHNVVTMLNQKNETDRFPFSYYIKLGKYDIEHIHPQNAKIPDSADKRKDWLSEKKIQVLDAGILDQINKFKKFDDEAAFQKIFDAVETYFADGIDDVLVDDLSNLCLLDAHTNRSYHNEFFPEKRIKIIREDQEGTFIPVCTKRVFQKYYTEKPSNMTFWNITDREAYMNDIKTALKIYLS